MMITEEFSFPVITNNNVVHLTVLPPLWRFSSLNEEQETSGRILRRVISRSFSEVEAQIMKVERDDTEAEAAEEKMDMLWEDFNEELRSSNDKPSNSGYLCNHHEDDILYDEAGRGGLCNYYKDDVLYDEAKDNINDCGLEMAPGRLIPVMKKKKKLKLVVKMMRKLFMLQNMARIKKRAGPRIID